MGTMEVGFFRSTGEQSDVSVEDVDVSVDKSSDARDGGVYELQLRGVDNLLEAQKAGGEVDDLGSGETGALAGKTEQKREETVVKAADVSNQGDGKIMQSDIAVVGVDASVNESGDGGYGGVSETLKLGDETLVVSPSSIMETVFGDTDDVVGGNSVVIHEDNITSEAVDQSSAKIVMPGLVSHLLEAVGEEKNLIAVTEDLLTSKDSAAVLDRLGEDAVTPLEATDAADSAKTEQPDVLVGPIYEGLDDGSPKDKASDVKTEDAESIDGKALTVESENMVQQTYAITSNLLDKDEGCVKQFPEMKHRIHDSEEKPLVCEGGEIGTVHQNYECIDGGGATEEKEKVQNYGIEDVMVENQPLDSTPMEVEAMNSQIAATSQVEVADGDVSSEEGKKTGLKTIMQSSDGLTGHTESYGVDVSTVTMQPSPKDSCLDVEMADANVVQDVTGNNLVVVDGDESTETCEKADQMTVLQSLEFTGDPESRGFDVSNENMQFSPKDSYLNVGTADAKAVRDHFMSNNSAVNTQIQPDNAGEKFGSPKGKELGDALEIAETSNHEADKFEGISLIPTEVAKNSDVSITNHTGIHSVEQQLGNEEPASGADKLMLSGEETKISAILLRKEMENGLQFSESDLVWGKVRSHPWWPAQIFTPEDASQKATKHYKKDAYLVAYFGDRTFAWNNAHDLKPFMSHFSQFKNQSNSDSFRNAVNCALDEVSRRVGLGLACSCIPREAYEKIECQVIDNAGICEESSHRYGVDQCTGAASFEPVKLFKYLSNLAPCASSRIDQLDLVIAQAQLASFYLYNGYRWSTEFHEADVILSADEKVYSRRSTSLKSTFITKDGSLSRKDKILPDVEHEMEYSSEAESESVSEDLGNSVPSSPGRKRKAIDSPSSTGNHLGKSVPLSSGRKRKAIYSPSSAGNHLGRSVPLSSGRKRKALDSLADESEESQSLPASKLPTSTSRTPKPSFKIGECIRRVASQLKGSAAFVKGKSSDTVTDVSRNVNIGTERKNVVVSKESFSVDEVLSQLELLSQNPCNGHGLQNNVLNLIMDFRSSVALKRHGKNRGVVPKKRGVEPKKRRVEPKKGEVDPKKRKLEPTTTRTDDEFEFDEVNELYWMDRNVQNYSQEQPSDDGEDEDEFVSSGSEMSFSSGERSHSRQRLPCGHYIDIRELDEDDEEWRKQESSPAELILNFTERECVPSEINLNKLFRRFGSLMESETEVNHELGRAKVIFKRGRDAEVTLYSAEKFNLFGAARVKYQIGYSPVISVKILPNSIPQIQADKTLVI